MSSKYEIEMNFRAAKEQARRLDDIASRLGRISRNDYTNALQQVSNAWQGDNANIYLQKSNGLIGKMNATASDLERIASTIRQIAQNIYDAEMRAWEIAHEREY